MREVWYTRAMSPPETPGDPPPGRAPRTSDPPIASAGGAAMPPSTGQSARRPQPWFAEGSPARRFVTRWGFPLFVLLILVLGREVLLPFVFAGLIAYIL